MAIGTKLEPSYAQTVVLFGIRDGFDLATVYKANATDFVWSELAEAANTLIEWGWLIGHNGLTEKGKHAARAIEIEQGWVA